jgi:hypothetical protein
MKKQFLFISTILLTAVFLLPGCLTSKKLDKFVAGQFNNELPKPDKKKNPDISVASSMKFESGDISFSSRKTTNFLPLLVYWQYDHRHTCQLNPAIGENYFRKTVMLQANKGLNQKLNGRQLELTVDQVPGAFSFTDKGRIIFLVVYAITWNKIYVEPDTKDLVVSYKLLDKGTTVKTGKITTKSISKNQKIRFFQSWKSAASEYLGQYSVDVAEMTRNFVNNLVREL